MRNRLLIAIAALLLVSPLPASATVSPQPGDTCTAGQTGTFANNAGSLQQPGLFLVCDGSNWNLFLGFTPAGMVGIGTAAPSTKLDVAGTARVADGGETCSSAIKGGIRYTSTNILQYCNSTAWKTLSASGPVAAAGMTGNIQYNSGGVLAASSTFTFTSAGRLGIGTAAPTSKLSVNGDISIAYSNKFLWQSAAGYVPSYVTGFDQSYGSQTMLLFNGQNCSGGVGSAYCPTGFIGPNHILTGWNYSTYGGESVIDVGTSGNDHPNLISLNNNYYLPYVGMQSNIVFDGLRTAGGHTQYAKIGAVMSNVGNTTYAGDLAFYTASDAAPTEKMRVTSAGNVGIDTAVPGELLYVSGGNVVATGSAASPTIAESGGGTRMMWYPKKAAFRAGYVDAAEWDDANIGNFSMASGSANTASGASSTAWGENAKASGLASTAIGTGVAAGDGTAGDGKGDYSLVMGLNSHSLFILGLHPPKVTGTGDLAIFMQDQHNDDIQTNNVMALMGGQLYINPASGGGVTVASVPTALSVNGTIQVADGGETCSATIKGGIRYSSGDKLQYCNSTAWQTLGGGGGTPASPVQAVQFNSAGAFGGNSNFVWDNANVRLGIGTAAPGELLYVSGGNVVATGQAIGSGPVLAESGAGTRMIWYPRLGAFRAGSVDDSSWNDANIGVFSAAFGFDTKVSGAYGSMAAGENNIVSGNASMTWGDDNVVSGASATGGGRLLTVSGAEGTAFGAYTQVGDGIPFDGVGDRSIAMGLGANGGTISKVTGVGSVGIFMENPSGDLVSANNTMALLGGKMMIDPTTGGGLTVSSVATALSVNGTVQVADGGETCSVAVRGGIRYISTNQLQICNSTSWETVSTTGLVATADATAQTTNIAPATLIIPVANTYYRISCMAVVTTAGSTSSSLPGCAVGYTDVDSNTAVTETFSPSTAGNLQGATQTSGSWLFEAKAGVPVTYSTASYASSAAGMQYAVHFKLEQMQ